MTGIEFLGKVLINGIALGAFLTLIYLLWLSADAITRLICGEDEE